MISKKFRLGENQVKKVLKNKKPFFSYGATAFFSENKYGYNKIGIILSGKQTSGSVNRNMIRRLVYDTSRPFLDRGSYDIVFTFPKMKLLDGKNQESRKKIILDIEFLMKKILLGGKSPKKKI